MTGSLIKPFKSDNFLPAVNQQSRNSGQPICLCTGGTGSVYDAMAQTVCERGGSVHLNTPVRRVARRTDGRLELKILSGKHRVYRHVVSSIPLTHLGQSLPKAAAPVWKAASALSFRNTILVYLRIEAERVFPDQWIYVHDQKLDVGRITNYRNWVPELYGNCRNTILSLELWCNPGDKKWREADERHIQRATEDLQQTGLIGNAAVTGSHVVRILFIHFAIGGTLTMDWSIGYLEPMLYLAISCNNYSNSSSSQYVRSVEAY